jgi:phenylalanyl-tRNA synthetase alpha chain
MEWREFESTIARFREDIRRALQEARSETDLQDIRVRCFGRQRGFLREQFKRMADLPPDVRPRAGQVLNELKDWLEREIEARRRQLREARLEEQLERERIDWTLPGTPYWRGAIHPIHQVRQAIEDIFLEMGYAVVSGPEVETDYYNFGALNFPPDHPARDMWDTLYIHGQWLLRTHTSPVQIRVMQRYRPPIRVIVPGKVYRHDEPDATHAPVFHQIEGLVVDRGIRFSDLRGTLAYFLQRLFGPACKMRFRPSYFPFTEPSAEVDMSCLLCGGQGCGTCKQSGWLEVLGAGMVHPNVLREVRIDPEEYSGFAFGLGIERLAMLMFRVPDIRLFLQGDVRFLEQFRTDTWPFQSETTAPPSA